MSAIGSKKSEWLIQEQSKAVRQEQPKAVRQVLNNTNLLTLIESYLLNTNYSQVSKHFDEGNKRITNNSWKKIVKDSQTDAFQKTHPTLCLYIQSQNVTNLKELTNQLRKEARLLDLTGSNEFQKTETSIAPKDLLALDKLIEQTNFQKANKKAKLFDILDNIALPQELLALDKLTKQTNLQKANIKEATVLAILDNITFLQARNYETWNERINTLEENQLDGITVLRLSDLNLTRIPNGICNFTSLSVLCLNSNHLKTLPVNFGNLAALQRLYLSGNRLPNGLNKTYSSPQKIKQLILDLQKAHSFKTFSESKSR